MHRNIGMAIANVHLGYYKGKTMKSMKTSKIIVAIVAATALGLGAAQATQINGTIGFTSATNHPGGPGGGIVNNGGGSFTLNFNNPLSVNFGTDRYPFDFRNPPAFQYGRSHSRCWLSFSAVGNWVARGRRPAQKARNRLRTTITPKAGGAH